MAFTTYNQFDRRFSNFEKFGSDRTACPLFGLITCYNFMKNNNIDQQQHEFNLQAAIDNYTNKNIPKYMMFDELLSFTNLNAKNINGTTPGLITENIIGYEHMFDFDNNGEAYCILLLKGRNFIAILCQNNKYSLRNCHENTQHDFHDFESLKEHLNNVYQFETQTIVDGIEIPEFDNIEFLTIRNAFKLVDIKCETVNDDSKIDQDYYLALCLENEDNDYFDFS